MVLTPASHEGSFDHVHDRPLKKPLARGVFFLSFDFSLMLSTAGCGAGPFAALPPGQRPVRIPMMGLQGFGLAGPSLRFGCSFTIRWLGHASENRKSVVVADQKIEESLHKTVEPLRMRGRRSLRSDRPHKGDRYPSESGPASRDAGHSIEVRSGTDPSRIRRLCFLSGNRGVRIGVVKLLRARGGCLGVIRETGVEGCDKSGGVAQRTSIPECL